MKKPKKRDITYTRACESDDDRTIYAILREEFTAEDLQKYTEIETLIPADEVLEKLDKSIRQKHKRKKA
jgi:hypothetical protein